MVVAIISMLMGLLLPAMVGARSRARIAQCQNNQHQLSMAIVHYESVKGHLPGYVNRIVSNSNNYTVGWPPVLLPYLGRMDLWEGVANSNFTPAYDGWRYATPILDVTKTSMLVRIGDFVCPDDPGATSNYPLTYVVSLGLYDNAIVTSSTTNKWPATTGGIKISTNPAYKPLFGDYSSGATNAVALSSVKSPSRTIMLSEIDSTLPVTYGTAQSASATDKTTPRQWSDYVTQSGRTSSLGFTWPDADITGHLKISISAKWDSLVPGPLPSIHPGVVIVTFCDGHTQSLPDSTMCYSDTEFPMLYVLPIGATTTPPAGT